jgi:hypothetical protein
MTFQPPPPPPGENPPPPPPPPPPGQWGPPPGGGAGRPVFDPKNVNPLDWGILAAGFLIFIFSFTSYYSASAGGVTVNESAWHGFFGWFAMLLALAGSVVVALELFMPQMKMPWPNRLVGLALYAVATLCVILALFIVPSRFCYGGVCGDVPGSVDKGHGFGYWISLILIIAGLVMSLMRLQQTGGKLPGPLANMPNIGAKGPQGGLGGQHNPPQPPPPPPGYGQPPGP